MQEITMDLAREKARSWQTQGEKWHFHVLFPDCVFNTQDNLYAMVLENRSTDETFVVYSEVGFAKASQELLKLHYGEHILDQTNDYQVPKDSPIRPILERCDKYNRDHVLWHHHMLFPDCIFNEHSGKWNIALEGKGESQIVNALYDDEPLDEFQMLEIAYFKEIDPSF